MNIMGWTFTRVIASKWRDLCLHCWIKAEGPEQHRYGLMITHTHTHTLTVAVISSCKRLETSSTLGGVSLYVSSLFAPDHLLSSRGDCCRDITWRRFTGKLVFCCRGWSHIVAEETHDMMKSLIVQASACVFLSLGQRRWWWWWWCHHREHGLDRFTSGQRPDLVFSPREASRSCLQALVVAGWRLLTSCSKTHPLSLWPIAGSTLAYRTGLERRIEQRKMRQYWKHKINKI